MTVVTTFGQLLKGEVSLPKYSFAEVQWIPSHGGHTDWTPNRVLARTYCAAELRELNDLVDQQAMLRRKKNENALRVARTQKRHQRLCSSVRRALERVTEGARKFIFAYEESASKWQHALGEDEAS